MKKLLPIAIVLVGVIVSVYSCRKTEYGFKPTYAIPLIDAELTVADIVGARPSEVDLVFESSSGGDSLFSYRLIYLDTLDPIDFGALSGSGGVIPPTGGNPITFPESRIYLRMTGRSENGRFLFTNPSVEFNIGNEFETGFELSLTNLYTENEATGQVVPFTITPEAGTYPIPISANDPNTNTLGSGFLEINSDNTSSGFDTVFTPSPKFLYYTPSVEAPTGGTYDPEDQMQVISRVVLPLEGYARATFRDTVGYTFPDAALDEIVDFAYLRMRFENGIPLEARITGTIVDTSTIPFTVIADLPLYDVETDELNEDAAVVPGGIVDPDATSSPTFTPTVKTTDIRIVDESESVDEVDVEDFTRGNAIILNIDFRTTEYSQSEIIKVFSDQTLKVNMGIKTRLGIEGEADWRDIRDTINSLTDSIN